MVIRGGKPFHHGDTEKAANPVGREIETLPSNGPLGPSFGNIDFGQRYGAAYYLSDAERWSSHI